MNRPETYEELCVRLAYYMIRYIARGTSAESIAHTQVQQVMFWQKLCKEYESKPKE